VHDPIAADVLASKPSLQAATSSFGKAYTEYGYKCFSVKIGADRIGQKRELSSLIRIIFSTEPGEPSRWFLHVYGLRRYTCSGGQQN
jgi:hypothetical protein